MTSSTPSIGSFPRAAGGTTGSTTTARPTSNPATLGPQETLPVREGDILLGRWQNIFLCEFDGPRASRDVLITILGD